MKRSDIVENEPLLYIVQPKLERTVAYMQRTFKSKAPVKQELKHKSEWENGEIVQENLNQQQGKQFQQMSLEEQLSFLASPPASLSHVKCKLVSIDGEKEGIIRKYDGTEITIDTVSGTFVIPRKEVVSIALIGLSRKEEEEQRDGD
ncbi:hypothetical protein H839_03161 [Parageobacillus genomosp. 1]|uniref:Spore coat protein CotO n=1 Tax=Parageobacillus genomosp. 1 TaxID=1295642 RepID=A0ABC9VJF1_9BACL|nr:hypothetical protein [Parageobacillus genomosp. 1]EZP78834.1 hypothetical protein H839_03161 [Parageobacillus genomosp. 1]